MTQNFLDHFVESAYLSVLRTVDTVSTALNNGHEGHVIKGRFYD